MLFLSLNDGLMILWSFDPLIFDPLFLIWLSLNDDEHDLKTE